MSKPLDESFRALTEKEKQTLRLIVRGHDAKSTARSLGLSVHTINERLRDARRKMAVSSSREAARLLLEAESGSFGSAAPNFLADTEIGEDSSGSLVDRETASASGVGLAFRHPWIIIGVFLMTFVLALLALTALPQIDSAPPPSDTHEAANPEVLNAARQWLELVDHARWAESYRATGKSFRKLNTPQAWAAASEKARAPLGKLLSRTFISQQDLAAPPHGYEVVKFRTSFANKADVVEAVTLDRENGDWRAVGVTID